jgi:hypothetical protein
MNKFRYLIGYMSINNRGFGRITIEFPVPITNDADVNTLEGILRERCGGPVMVLSFSQFPDREAGGSR